MKSVLIHQAVALLMRLLFRVSRKNFEVIRTAVEQAEQSQLPGKTYDGTPSKDGWVRDEVGWLIKTMSPHVFEWLLGLAVQMVKSRV